MSVFIVSSSYRNDSKREQQYRQRACNVTRGRVHATLVAVKAIRVTYSECMFATLVIKNAMRMRHIVILPYVAKKIKKHYYTNTMT